MEGMTSRRPIFPIIFAALCIALGGCYEGTAGTTGDGATDTVSDDGAAADGTDGPVEEGEGPDWATCQAPSDCVIVSNGCCDACGMPTLADVDGVNKSFLDEHFGNGRIVIVGVPQNVEQVAAQNQRQQTSQDQADLRYGSRNDRGTLSFVGDLAALGCEVFTLSVDALTIDLDRGLRLSLQLG